MPLSMKSSYIEDSCTRSFNTTVSAADGESVVLTNVILLTGIIIKKLCIK